MVGVCGPPGGSEDGGAGAGVGWEVWAWGRACCVVVCVPLQQHACVVTCRPGGLEVNLAVFCGHGKDFADECAYLLHLLVSGGKRVL